MVTRGAPTLDDAKRAAEALIGAGAAEVWLYGSVARGEQRRRSDIDLVALFDDVSYQGRLRRQIELEGLASRACGRQVQVMVTDRPEWRIQREQVTASFANAITCDLMLLASTSEPPGEVDWEKEQVMATSNEELSAERLDAVRISLRKIRSNRAPADVEAELSSLDDPGEYLEERGARLIMVCEAAHMVIENAAKALAVLEDVEAKTLWTHDVAKLVGALEEPDSGALGEIIARAPGLIKSPDYITMWRNIGVYGTPGEGLTVYEVATPHFAEALALMACDVAEHVASTALPRLDGHAAVTRLRQVAASIRDYLGSHSIADGEPADG